MQWKRRRRVHYVIGSGKRALLLRQYRLLFRNVTADVKLPEEEQWLALLVDQTDDRGEVSGQNEDDVDDQEEGSSNPDSHQNGYYRKYKPNNGYRYHHQSGQKYAPTPSSQQNGEKKLFNEDEYTKITTPRQDVLFKKGYLGRKRPVITPAVSEASTGELTNGDRPGENGESQDNQSEASSETVTSQDHSSFIYTNGYLDAHGGPIFYLNGMYDMYEPYSGVYSSVMVPAGPGYAGAPAVAGSMLTAVPCQPLPLQPLEWFNPRGPADLTGSWCVMTHCPAPIHHPSVPVQLQRKCYSTDSQNCSPHSTESTGATVSPQHENEEVEMLSPEVYSQPPAPYVYPGYMFGSAVYNVNGVVVRAPSPVPTSNGTEHLNGNSGTVNGGTAVDSSANAAAAQAKRRKKKRRKKRRRGFRGEGAGSDEGSEESSSEEGLDEKDLIDEGASQSNVSTSEVDGSMSASSPGNVSGSASMPPATSESCSELSAASSSHNSHDETESAPLRPNRKHTNDVAEHNSLPVESTRSTAAAESQDAPQERLIQKSQAATENQAYIPGGADEINHTVADVLDLPNDSIDSSVQQDHVQIHQDVHVVDDVIVEASLTLLTDAVSTPVQLETLESTGNLAFTSKHVEPSAKVQETTKGKSHSEKGSHKGGKVSRKASRKSKQQQQGASRQMPKKVSSEENVATKQASPPLQRSVSSLSNRESLDVEEKPYSPVPPPRRRGKARHRPPTPCSLTNDHDTLAQDLSDAIIQEAVEKAAKQCGVKSQADDVPQLEAPAQRPITDAVTKWLNTNPDPLIHLDDLSDTEEDGNDTTTGSKNGLVNPLHAPSNSFVNMVSTDGPQQRVVKLEAFLETQNIANKVHHQRMSSTSSTSSTGTGCSGEWDAWDHPCTQHSRAVPPHRDAPECEQANIAPSKYDPAVSVAKYYQLTHDPVMKLKPHEAWLSASEVISDSGIESGDEPHSPKTNPQYRSIKFMQNLQGGLPDTEPFPCGACCSIQ